MTYVADAQIVSIRDEKTKEIVFAILLRRPLSLIFYLPQSKLWILQPFEHKIGNFYFKIIVETGTLISIHRTQKTYVFCTFLCFVHIFFYCDFA